MSSVKVMKEIFFSSSRKKNCTNLPIPEDTGDIVVSGDIITMIVLGTSLLVYDISQPRWPRRRRRSEWRLDFDFSILQLALDSSQDLLAMVETPRPVVTYEGPWNIYIKSLTTGGKATEAAGSCLTLPIGKVLDCHPSYGYTSQNRTVERFIIQVHDCYVGVMYGFVPAELVIWNWKTGQTVSKYRHEEYRTFSFLPGNRVVIGANFRGFTPESYYRAVRLLVFQLDGGGFEYSSPPSGTTFLLPSIDGSAGADVISISNGHTTLGASSVITDDSVIVVSVLTRNVELNILRATHVIPVKALISHPDSDNLVQWKDWGQKNTHLWTSGLFGERGAPEYHVSGCRIAFLDTFSNEENCWLVRVVDFHRRRVKRALQRRSEDVKQGAESHGQAVFDEATITTQLPFTETKMRLPREIGRQSTISVLVGGNSLVVVEGNRVDSKVHIYAL
ncbi:hypothetical protein OF83DRAFT_456955 [Amylostereum chailletii]|nr:hypothetical protein OF83DRAFT_456955 [Amylostereum chailletii]